jgi:dephospho-CoA kinase
MLRARFAQRCVGLAAAGAASGSLFGSSACCASSISQRIDELDGRLSMLEAKMNPPKLLLGITGTLGAGKGTVVDYLMEKHGFLHYSVRSYLTEVIKERGLPVNRDSMTMVANELRAKNSPSYLIEQLLVKAAADTSGNGAIIESIRTPGEIDALEAIGEGNFFLVAVDCDPALRYSRITGRGSATDSVSFDKFLSDEKREMTSTDPNKQNLSVCIQRSSYTLANDTTKAEFHAKIDVALSEMQKAASQAAKL